MDVYLMRHGQAEVDAPRPLSREGAAAVDRVGARAATLGIRPDRIYHSGILRAQQTAEILARHLGGDDRVEKREGLAPEDPVEPAARWLLDQAGLRGSGGIVLVGHLPFLGLLVSRLVAGDEAAQVAAFEAGALVKLVPKGEREGFSIAWILTPELA